MGVSTRYLLRVTGCGDLGSRSLVTPEPDLRSDVQQEGVGDGGTDAVGEVWHRERCNNW